MPLNVCLLVLRLLFFKKFAGPPMAKSPNMVWGPHTARVKTKMLNLRIGLFKHRWAQIAIPLISEANFFLSGLAVQLTFKNVSGLVIEANFFSQSARIRIVATAVLVKKSL